MDTRFLTCRYWALGPRCPNIDENGVEACDFAHRDTGFLASSVAQRGTCANWIKNRCSYGENCYYEHRYTGVMGLYQGVIPLGGLDLEIANAASASNFNTYNHEALMDLIWSVKRVVLRHQGVNNNAPPPKDPVYPDRYRPCGIGDNTKYRRTIPHNFIPPRHKNPSVNFRKRKSKGKKRKIQSSTLKPEADAGVLHQVLGASRISKSGTKPSCRSSITQVGGTQYNPISLLSDVEDDHMGSNVVSRALTVCRKFMPDSTSLGRYEARLPIAIGGAEDSNTHQLATKSIFSLLDTMSDTRANSTTEINAILNTVKQTLETTQKDADRVRTTMKTLYSKNGQRLSDYSIYTIMEKLSEEVFHAHSAAGRAIEEVNKSITWLKRANGVDAKDEML